jgi:hypothetical protein
MSGGASRWLAALVAFPLLLIPVVGRYLAVIVFVAILIFGFVRMRRRDKARGM